MGVYDSDQFKRLRRTYYRKLKRSGFEDIEKENGQLTSPHSQQNFSRRIGFKTEFSMAVSDYYSWAESQLESGLFKNETDKLIWEMHSQGKSSREIAKAVGYFQTWVCKKIKQIRKYLQ